MWEFNARNAVAWSFLFFFVSGDGKDAAVWMAIKLCLFAALDAYIISLIFSATRREEKVFIFQNKVRVLRGFVTVMTISYYYPRE
jgi:hypothetical protein